MVWAEYTRNPTLALTGLLAVAGFAYYIYHFADATKHKDKDGHAAQLPKPKAEGQQDLADQELYGDGQAPLFAYVGGIKNGYDFYGKAKYPTPNNDRARMRTDQSDGFPLYVE